MLFFTELWERFSYYGMRALFTIFLVAETTDQNPGFGWTNEKAIWLYGWYTMLVYIAAIPGGWLADNFLGQKKKVMFGGLLLCLGHGVHAAHLLQLLHVSPFIQQFVGVPLVWGAEVRATLPDP